MKWLEEIIDRVNAGGISGEWATKSQVAASSAVDKLELPAIPDDAVVDLIGCLIDEIEQLREAFSNAERYGVETKARLRDANSEIERLREEITDGDYWHKRATQALEVGTCPLCFSVDESGHEANCPWGDAEDRAERFGAELDRLREWVAAVEDGYDKQQAEIKRLKAEREDQMELGRELRRRLNREIE